LEEPVELEPGNVFRRYGGDSLVDVEVRPQLAPEPWSLPAEWIGFLVASVLGAAGVFGYRFNRRRGSAPVAEQPLSREELLTSIAQLDEEFQGLREPTAEQQSAYRKRRDALKAALKPLR
jgi:hypothetical protein